MKIVTLKSGKLKKRISFRQKIIYSMDAIDSRNPFNLETKNKR